MSRFELLRRRAKSVMRVPGAILLAILIIWAFVHAVRTRTVGDFIRYPSYIWIPLISIFLIVILSLWARSGFARPAGENIVSIIFFPLFLAYASVTYYTLGVGIKDAYLWLQAQPISEMTTSKTGLMLLATLTTLTAGTVLFFFRLRLRCVYGLTEAIVGVTVAANRVATQEATTFLHDTGFYLALLTAGIYLVVRGLDNIHQGLTKDPVDPMAAALKRWFENMFAGSVTTAADERSTVV